VDDKELRLRESVPVTIAPFSLTHHFAGRLDIMTSLSIIRLIRPGLALLLVCWLLAHTTATAQVEKVAPPATVKDLIAQGIKAANEEKFDVAVSALEEAATLDPKDRQPLYILSVFTNLAADKAKTSAEKVALLRRSTAAFGKLRDTFKPLSLEEEDFADRSKLDEVRILAIDGKPKPALDAVVQLVGQGYQDLDAIAEQADLQPVRDLPDFRSRMNQALGPLIKESIAATKSFPFDFNLKDVDGKAVKLADSKGKVTIVDVWGTWCPPCRKEIPHFVDLAARYEAKGLRIVGINCNEEGSPAEVKKTINDFKAETKIKYPCVLNDDTTEGKIPGFQGYPTTLFLDRAGKVRLVLVGYTPLSRLEAIVTTLLAEPTP